MLTNMIIKNINFPIYYVMILLSLIISLIYIFKALKENNINIIYNYSLLYMISAFIFGILFTLISHLPKIEIGLTSYGCGIGVIILSLILRKYLNINDLFKYTIISLPLTYSIAKIGCFFTGCCVGIPYSGILSITYIDKSNISLFPIQLLETIVFFIVFLICNKLKNKKNIIYITLIMCSICKLLLDFLRYEHIYKPITINQIISILIIGFIVILYKKKKLMY